MISSRLPKVDIPNIPFHDYFFNCIKQYGENCAMINEKTNERISFLAIREKARWIANAIINLGAKKGEIVVICADSSPEALLVFLGISLAGAAASSLSPRLHAEEMRTQIEITGARLFFVDPHGLAEVEKVFATTEKEHRIICLGTREEAKIYPIMSDLKYIVRPKTDFPLINPREDIVNVPFSSGIQGIQKGIITSHFVLNARIASSYNPRTYEHMRPGHYTVAMVPFFKQMGIESVLISLMTGATVVTVPSAKIIRVEDQLRALEKYQVRMVTLTPLKMTLMIREMNAGTFNITHLSTVITGTAAVSKQLYDEFRDTFRSVSTFIQTYGMTEVGLITRSRPLKHYSPSCGTIVSGMNLKVVDLVTGKTLGPNQRGGIFIQSETASCPYLNNEKATYDVFQHGWRKTGDIGYYDEEENVFIVDKNKEMMKVYGFQVIPTELETLLLSHDSVKEAAVVPISDLSAGERPVAFVVLKPNHIVSPDEIIAYVNERVVRYKQLVRVQITQTLPRSPGGSLLRRLLTEAATININNIA